MVITKQKTLPLGTETGTVSHFSDLSHPFSFVDGQQTQGFKECRVNIQSVFTDGTTKRQSNLYADFRLGEE